MGCRVLRLVCTVYLLILLGLAASLLTKFSFCTDLHYVFRYMMSFRLLIKDQLIVFLDSLKNQIAAKHDVIPESFPEHVDFVFGETVKLEVTRLKLETAPSFKPTEYGLQCRLVQNEKMISIYAFCFKDFKQPDSNDDNKAAWGKVTVNLATLSKASDRLSRGLEHRSIRIGLSREYIRMLGESDVHMSFVRAGNGFSKAHWHLDSDIEAIIQYRLTAQKLIKLTGDHKNSEDRMYCGNDSAVVEYLNDDGKWEKAKNSSVVSKKEGMTSPDGVVASKGKGSEGVNRSEEDISTQIESSDRDEFFGGYGGAESLEGSRDAEGAMGSGIVTKLESPEGSGTNSVRPDPAR